VKIFGAVLFILGFLSAQPFNFDAGNNYCDSENYVKSIITSSSLWSTSSPLVHPMTKSRLIFQAGLSFFNKNSCGKYWIYPNFDIAYKVTKNLALTSKIFGLTEESDSPQVLGGGIEYYFGSSDTLNWSTAIQRVDLKGLKDFRLTSLNINLYRWISLYKLKIRIGAGSNFFKEKSYFNNEEIPLRMEGQINYFGADILFINNIIIFGCNSRINPDKTIMNIFLQKEIF
jgi:hypothetical protein